MNMESSNPRTRIAARAARELHAGEVVNLGIGIPTLLPSFLPAGAVLVHTENGMLGVGPSPSPEEIDPDLIDAGKQHVTAQPDASYFDSAMSFALIRGGHVDAAVVGALEVNSRGQVANWHVSGSSTLGVGGAMDLLAGARRVIVTTTHTTSGGAPKIVEETKLPLTSLRPADLLITDLAVFALGAQGLTLIEIIDETMDLAGVAERTGALFADGRDDVDARNMVESGLAGAQPRTSRRTD